MHLIAIKKRFQEFKNYVEAKIFFSLFIKNIKDFMKGIRMRILQEMKQYKVLIKSKIARRYSYDDYFLIESQF